MIRAKFHVHSRLLWKSTLTWYILPLHIVHASQGAVRAEFFGKQQHEIWPNFLNFQILLFSKNKQNDIANCSPTKTDFMFLMF